MKKDSPASCGRSFVPLNGGHHLESGLQILDTRSLLPEGLSHTGTVLQEGLSGFGVWCAEIVEELDGALHGKVDELALLPGRAPASVIAQT